MRIRGFVAHGDLRPDFCGVVCARLLRVVSMYSLRRSGGDRRECRALLRSLEVWASKTGSALDGMDIREGLPHRSSMEAIAVQEMERMGLDTGMTNTQRGVEALILNKHLASQASAKRVCLYCVAAHLTGEEGHELEVNDDGRGMVLEGQRLALLITAGSEGSVEAMVRAHNREMHAANGNIHFTCEHEVPRLDVVENCLAKSLRPVRHQLVVQFMEQSRQRSIQEELPMLVYSTGNSAGVALVNAPPTPPVENFRV